MGGSRRAQPTERLVLRIVLSAMLNLSYVTAYNCSHCRDTKKWMDFQCQSPSEYRSTNFGACISCRNDVFSDTSIGAKLCTLCKGKGQHKITRNNAWVNHNEVCSRCFGTGLEMKCNAYSTHVGVEKRNPANSPQNRVAEKTLPWHGRKASDAPTRCNCRVTPS